MVAEGMCQVWFILYESGLRYTSLKCHFLIAHWQAFKGSIFESKPGAYIIFGYFGSLENISY